MELHASHISLCRSVVLNVSAEKRVYASCVWFTLFLFMKALAYKLVHMHFFLFCYVLMIMVLAWIRSTCYIDLFNLMPEKVIDLPFLLCSQTFKVGWTFRFPRAEKLRDDKYWHDCLSLQGKKNSQICFSYVFSITQQLQRIWRILSLWQFKPWWRLYALRVATDCDYQYGIVSLWPVVANLWFFKQQNLHFMFALWYPQWEARSEQIMMVGG